MRRQLFCWISLALVLGWTAAAVGQENVIVNGEFDSGLDSWGLYGGTGFVVSVVQDAALSGANAAFIDITDAAAASAIGIAQGPLPLVQGETYPIGFTAKADRDREIVILMQLNDSGVSWTDIFIERASLTTEPQEFVFEYTHTRESTEDHPEWSFDIYFMLKGAYWAMSGSDLNSQVWIDRIHFGEPEEVQVRTKAVGPDPEDGGAIETPWYMLKWLPGEFAVSHNLYIGENFDDVNEGNVDVFATSAPLATVGTGDDLYPDGLIPGTTYYWRIDEVNDAHPDSPWKGDVWSFLVRPWTAWQPTPADGAKLVIPNQDLSWEVGTGTLFHTVYFGDNFDDVNDATTGGFMITQTTYDPGTLETDKTYYWRVDEFSQTGTHKGDVWSFTTVHEVPIGDPDLIGWWTFDEGEGITAVDQSGYGGHGAIVGGPQRVDGYYGQALDFTASGQYVNCGDTAGQEITNDFTLAAWARMAPETTGVYGGIAGKLTNTTTYMGFALVRHSTNVFRLWVGDATTDLAKSAVSSDVLYMDAEWHHVAGVREGQINSLYVDGVKQAGTSETEFVASPEWFHIGRQYSHMDDRYFRGTIDDVRLYNKALTDAELADAMRGDPLMAADPEPGRGALVDIRDLTTLRWSAGDTAASHDVYFGKNRDAVVAADRDATEYQGNQPGTSFSVAGLVEFAGGNYYWRIDEVEADGTTIHQGDPWKFTVLDFLVVDNFESYTNEVGQRVFEVWVDGVGFTQPVDTPGNGTGALVGHDIWSADSPYTTIVETGDVNGGSQAMPLYYSNSASPFYSEAERTWAAPQNWTVTGADTLTLYVRGEADNGPAPLYVAIEDTAGRVAVATHADPAATTLDDWTEWNVPFADLTAAGVSMTTVKKMYIGVGSRTAPTADGAGVIYVDDIRVTKPGQ
ncbi:MAG: carbohydrate binding domain-containing protein [Sedimentisphaerales bacterium]|nr:carbohydrate binding domain-containing protein [Sedimentisphaerales bacterium]